MMPVDPREEAGQLRSKAARARRVALAVRSMSVGEGLRRLAEEYEARASLIERLRRTEIPA